MTGGEDPAGMPQPSVSPERQRAYRWGLSAETLVAWALRLKGYRILARRYRVSRGEIDLIIRRGRLVAFVEVKARATAEEAMAAVTWRSRRRIEAAAAVWSARHPDYADFDHRFDIVAVRPWRWPLHIADAYRIGE